jgi:PIN domain nuclease of toxin-antitoxin system
MQPLLLDTCAVIWIAEDEGIAQEATDALNAAYAEGLPTYVSPITAWELGLLVARERLKLLITPERWFERLLALPNVRLADMRPDILIASSFLPGTAPRDPADRIIAATARDLGCMLMTRDRAMLEYGEQGHLNVLKC